MRDVHRAGEVRRVHGRTLVLEVCVISRDRSLVAVDDRLPAVGDALIEIRQRLLLIELLLVSRCSPSCSSLMNAIPPVARLLSHTATPSSRQGAGYSVHTSSRFRQEHEERVNGPGRSTCSCRPGRGAARSSDGLVEWSRSGDVVALGQVDAEPAEQFEGLGVFDALGDGLQLEAACERDDGLYDCLLYTSPSPRDRS